MAAHGGFTDRSGTVATGGTAQDALSANTGRQYLLIQNIHATEDMWVRLGADAAADTAGNILLKAGGGSVEWTGTAVPTARISVVAATTGHKFTAYEA